MAAPAQSSHEDPTRQSRLINQATGASRSRRPKSVLEWQRMIRRFVNVVWENYSTNVYSLHRLDVSKHLFHQSRADARVVPLLAEAAQHTAAAAAAADVLPLLDRQQELPAPCVKIDPSYRDDMSSYKLPFWGLLSPRSSEDRVLCLNRMGDAVLCDLDKQSVVPMLPLRDDVGIHPTSFSVVRPDAHEQEEEEDLYVIHRAPQMDLELPANRSCFRVLRSCNSKDDGARWRWEPLPPPPYIGAPGYNPACFIYACTVVDEGRTICVSSFSEDIGTYCFDTVERRWRHVGHWVLPFQGRAEYVPDLNLWLGFSSCSQHCYLCATSELDDMDMDQPPKLQYVWQDLVAPENWSAGRTWVVSLGSGRFCIAKSFYIMKSASVDDWDEHEDEVVILTGVEVGRGGDDRLETGLYSLHRVDVPKHLFFPSRSEARVVPFVAESEDNITAAGVDDEQPMPDRLQELPSATTMWSSSNVDYFSLLSSRRNESRILCMSKMGAAVLYDPDSNYTRIMPGLSSFKGPVLVSAFVARAGAKEEDLYIMHGGADGLELNSKYHFNVLRYEPMYRWWHWYWESLPLPPFVDEPQFKPSIISSYTVVDGGRTICLSSAAEGIGTYFCDTVSCERKRAANWSPPFTRDTVSCEWKRAGDWVLPFTGRAEYIPHLELWLGFSLRNPGYLCAASGLSDMLMDQQPMTSRIVWPDHAPKAARVDLLNMGLGRFAVAKVFKVVRNKGEPGLFSEPDAVEDEFVVLTGVEVMCKGDNNLQGLELLQHKSICYRGANDRRPAGIGDNEGDSRAVLGTAASEDHGDSVQLTVDDCSAICLFFHSPPS
ncbi:hypothetical protein EJB05_05131, partial [Eragrostis curvula]